VLLSGYWPVIGRSAVVVPLEGAPVLLAPEMEKEALEQSTLADVRTFQVWHLDDPAPDDVLRTLLRQVASDRGLRGKRIGVEGGFEDVAPTQKVLEPWAPATLSREIITDAFGERLVDATRLLGDTRARKTSYEVSRIRTAGEIAVFGLEAFTEAVRPGRREIEIAAAVEHAVAVRGTGHSGVRHARAQALVFSGEDRLTAYSWGVAPTSPRVVEDGDMVMLELSVVADGYYADVTRVRAAGQISSQVRQAYEAVREAQAEAVRAVRPAVAWSAVDASARNVLRSRGYGEAFIHHTGHGVGFRYHEPIPFLHPQSQGVLEEGMVLTVEPGIYGSGVGGIRIEDNVAVGPAGAVMLTEYSRDL
jgi:Xaa-Pro dipeptidase